MTSIYGYDDASPAPYEPESAVTIRSRQQLQGDLRSDIVYIIDGIIDMGNVSIVIPAGGLSLRGWSFDVSQLISTEDNYTLFTSPVGGSGNLVMINLGIDISGNSSQVYDIISATSSDAFEINAINYNNCTSLGSIDNYRQGFEAQTGRFGGSPNLTLVGAWSGGYFVDQSIVRGLDAGSTGALFQAGLGFTMVSRFRLNMNVDLSANMAIIDFAPANFANPSSLQLTGCIVTRNGLFDAEDPNLSPNISFADIESAWNMNVGIENTYEGGQLLMTAEANTAITTIGQYEPIAGTWDTDLLEHFDSPASGELLHLGFSPREYRVTVNCIIVGTRNDELGLRIRKYDDSKTATITVLEASRQVNNLSGARDIAVFDIVWRGALDQNDYVFIEITNFNRTENLILENGGVILVERL